MYIAYDPDMYEVVCERHVCHYHKAHPGAPYAGCTCSASFGQKLRPREEYEAIKARKVREEEDRILAQAEIIKARRAILAGGSDGE